MARRQRVWSHAHGFKFGRKLTDWGQDQSPGGSPEPDGALSAEDEQAQLRQAMRLSLIETGMSEQDAEAAAEEALHAHMAPEEGTIAGEAADQPRGKFASGSLHGTERREMSLASGTSAACDDDEVDWEDVDFSPVPGDISAPAVPGPQPTQGPAPMQHEIRKKEVDVPAASSYPTATVTGGPVAVTQASTHSAAPSSSAPSNGHLQHGSNRAKLQSAAPGVLAAGDAAAGADNGQSGSDTELIVSSLRGDTAQPCVCKDTFNVSEDLLVSEAQPPETAAAAAGRLSSAKSIIAATNARSKQRLDALLGTAPSDNAQTDQVAAGTPAANFTDALRSVVDSSGSPVALSEGRSSRLLASTHLDHFELAVSPPKLSAGPTGGAGDAIAAAPGRRTQASFPAPIAATEPIAVAHKQSATPHAVECSQAAANAATSGSQAPSELLAQVAKPVSSAAANAETGQQLLPKPSNCATAGFNEASESVKPATASPIPAAADAAALPGHADTPLAGTEAMVQPSTNSHNVDNTGLSASLPEPMAGGRMNGPQPGAATQPLGLGGHANGPQPGAAAQPAVPTQVTQVDEDDEDAFWASVEMPEIACGSSVPVGSVVHPAPGFTAPNGVAQQPPPPVALFPGAHPANGSFPSSSGAPPPPVPQPPPALIDIDAELDALEAESHHLKREGAKAARSAEGPTADMYADCQELLQLFGLPFIVAPTEVSWAAAHYCTAAWSFIRRW